MDLQVSIHAPVMDANLTITLNNLVLLSFNPRARDGREISQAEPSEQLIVSIHAPVMDANRRIRISRKLSLFQSTRP